MNNIEKICELFYEEIKLRFNKEPLDIDLEFSDNFAEILEKILILHLRVWVLEDKIALAQTDKEVADLKHRIDYCFKEKRPKLIRSLNLMLDDYISKNKPFAEKNLKEYQGFKQ